ncbi:hypothetical protein MEM_05491 [Candida albicans L26]|uniref:Uncharacterized protein n=1 Tax=Candida albicans (strain SC5314 / ATCC MYA-2876) TaxID=237561 RepID=Q5A899_CANAL|nr:uncharacterized protein CAALFM_CR01250CA [Candida albicans SC5314]KGU03208.1 hypothetical protein MEM_05491 [Candida albicans L26]KGU03477.1 hypothetical protein MEY_05445 [Candida albicans 19F]KGU20006.1 hypothetical protein MG7_05485 [Candida albicans P34048]KGU22376.1 hypothetical protein MGK_05487 [Candida albicans P57055]KHC46217.1 hypothetical protein MGC_05466 [Candida albicans P37039]KHC67100.1 hypothetical protein MGS_05506 [Candida albicans P78042]|eukprot:XP_717920.1 hypothetical protein CAALFM_CR01250CA [Candida albicans SC5314]
MYTDRTLSPQKKSCSSEILLEVMSSGGGRVCVLCVLCAKIFSLSLSLSFFLSVVVVRRRPTQILFFFFFSSDFWNYRDIVLRSQHKKTRNYHSYTTRTSRA